MRSSTSADDAASRDQRRAVLDAAGGRLGASGLDAVERAGARGEPQQPQDLGVDGGLGHPPGAAPRRRAVSPHWASGPGIVRSRAAAFSGLAVVQRPPVRDDDAVEAPLGLQRLGEQVVLGHRDAVDAVVRGHHHPGPGVDDGRLERRARYSSRSVALVDPVVDGEPVGLGVVGDVVLGAGADPAGLDAPT